MRVERYDQLIRPQTSPHATVDAVGGTNHPAEIEAHPFARASIGRGRHKKSDSDSAAKFTTRIELLVAGPQHACRKAPEGSTGVLLIRHQPRNECLFQRAMLLQKLPQHPEEHGEISTCVE